MKKSNSIPNNVGFSGGKGETINLQGNEARNTGAMFSNDENKIQLTRYQLEQTDARHWNEDGFEFYEHQGDVYVNSNLPDIFEHVSNLTPFNN